MNSLSDFSGRLVTLNDGRAGIRGGMHVEIRDPAEQRAGGTPSPGAADEVSVKSKSDPGQGEGEPSPNPSSCVLDFISSDESLDRYNEVISAAGWKLANYQRNPVFQNAHQTGDILHTIGRALITEVRHTGVPSPGGEGKGEGGLSLFQRIEFACDINPMAKIAYGLYRGKFLNAVSVGFVPLRWENGTEKSGYSRKFVEQELLEVSAVAIPANPHALALGLKSGAIEKSDLKDVVDLFRSQLSSTPERSEVPIPNRDPSSSNSQDQLMRLFLDFRNLLRS